MKLKPDDSLVDFSMRWSPVDTVILFVENNLIISKQSWGNLINQQAVGYGIRNKLIWDRVVQTT